MAYALQQGIGIERGYMTTIHAYTGDQNTVDTLRKDFAALALRVARLDQRRDYNAHIS